MDTVTDGTYSVEYDYLANSSFVETMTFKHSGTTRMTSTKVYDNVDRLRSITHKTNSVTMASYTYDHNTASQRTKVAEADGSYWLYEYDALGQVKSGKKYWTDGTPVAGQQFEYAFDDIGNRRTTAAGGDEWGANLRYASYSANTLNQYTSRTVPGGIDVIGTAKKESTVTVNNQPTYRRKEYYRGELAWNNMSSAVWQSVTNLAVLQDGANPDIVTNKIGNVFLPQTAEQFLYDEDGNLTNDGRWVYTWDAENRLKSMTAKSAIPSGAKVALAFAYDHQGRRIQTVVSNWTGSAYAAQSTNKFIYDGWNLIAELDAENTLLRSYTWGLDLSGSEQGAGGVGGLVTVNLVTNVHFAAFDGNGNVMTLLDVTNELASAEYAYDPFGRPIRGEGPVARSNPFRFSTKYTDHNTDLIYYGLRWYNHAVGRWLSRDPAGEHNGGPALYSLAHNDAIDRIDVLGLWHRAAHRAMVKDWLGNKYSKILWYCCPLDVAGFIMAGSDEVDGTLDDSLLWSLADKPGGFFEAQKTKNAYQHAMRAGVNQSPGEAEMLYRQFVNKNIQDALHFHNQARRTRDRWCYWMPRSLIALGKAYHAISDGFSPAHEGFQSWWGPGDPNFPGSITRWGLWAKAHADIESEHAYNVSPQKQYMKNALDRQLGLYLEHILENEF